MIENHAGSFVRYANFDPTSTTTLRKLFVKQFKLRFSALISAVKESIVANLCFGLKENRLEAFTSARNSIEIYPIPFRQFEFRTNDEKVSSFMKWLNDSEDFALFSLGSEFRWNRSKIKPIWANSFVADAYRHGILWGRRQIRRDKKLLDSLGLMKDQVPISDFEISYAFSNSVNADLVSLLYTRTYNDLVGITSQMDAEISRILAEEIVKGINPREIAGKIADRILSVGLHRATILARTEVIRAHHIASIQTYRDYGVKGVSVDAEWKTAGDQRVCPICASLEGKIFSLDEIYGKIPVHPQCRCAALPVIV